MSHIMRHRDASLGSVVSIPRPEASRQADPDTAVLADAARAIDTVLARAHEQGALDAVRVLGNLSSLLRALPR